jgi:DNA helicase-2/ATP-dependent DNA helicase PcrA
MTRAEKALYLSEAEGRNLDGSPRYPSRFLLDIDHELLDYTEEAERRAHLGSQRVYSDPAKGSCPPPDRQAFDVGQRSGTRYWVPGL